jgi:hypothetical protein
MHAGGLIPAPRHIGRSTRWSRRELVDWIDAGCPPRSEWQARQAAKKSRERIEQWKNQRAAG